MPHTLPQAPTYKESQWICWTCEPYVCLRLPRFLWPRYMRKYTHTHKECCPTHVYTCVIYTHHPTVHITHLRTSHTLHLTGKLLSGGLVSAFSTLFLARQKHYAKAHFPSWRVALCLKHRDLLFYVQEHEGKMVTEEVRKKKKKD